MTSNYELAASFGCVLKAAIYGAATVSGFFIYNNNFKKMGLSVPITNTVVNYFRKMAKIIKNDLAEDKCKELGLSEENHDYDAMDSIYNRYINTPTPEVFEWNGEMQEREILISIDRHSEHGCEGVCLIYKGYMINSSICELFADMKKEVHNSAGICFKEGYVYISVS